MILKVGKNTLAILSFSASLEVCLAVRILFSLFKLLSGIKWALPGEVHCLIDRSLTRGESAMGSLTSYQSLERVIQTYSIVWEKTIQK